MVAAGRRVTARARSPNVAAGRLVHSAYFFRIYATYSKVDQLTTS